MVVLIAVLAILVAALIVFRPGGIPVGETSPSPTTPPTHSAQATGAAPTPTTTETATPSATPISTDLAWAETGSFGAVGSVEFASGVARGPAGFVAVGTHYDTALPILGPLPPHEGRIWTSPDGEVWEVVETDANFTDAVLSHVITAADDIFIAIGRITTPDGFEAVEPTAAWESADGLTWTSIDLGFPDGFALQDVDGGAQGYAALLGATAAADQEIWLSHDGLSWELVWPVGPPPAPALHLTGIGAGDEGFVAIGSSGEGDTAEGFVMASADGLEWFVGEIGTPASGVVPAGGDWFALTSLAISDASTELTPTWSSANGLDWTEVGAIDLETVEPAPGTTCQEFPTGFLGAGRWLVAGTILSYPCSEGGVVTHGRQWLSVDGITWVQLPLPAASFADLNAIERGSEVAAAIPTDSGLLLVSNSEGRATFWLGESP